MNTSALSAGGLRPSAAARKPDTEMGLTDAPEPLVSSAPADIAALLRKARADIKRQWCKQPINFGARRLAVVRLAGVSAVEIGLRMMLAARRQSPERGQSTTAIANHWLEIADALSLRDRAISGAELDPSDVSAFAEAHLVRRSNGRVRGSTLFDVYGSWCARTERRPTTAVAFHRSMRAAAFTLVKERRHIWAGVELRRDPLPVKPKLPRQPAPEPGEFTAAQVERAIGVSQYTLIDWRRRGFLSGIGRAAGSARRTTWLYSRDDLGRLAMAKRLATARLLVVFAPVLASMQFDVPEMKPPGTRPGVRKTL